MAFGGFGKTVGGAFKKMGQNMKTQGGVNAAPSGGFWKRFGQATPGMLNAAAQQYGGPMSGAAKMSSSLLRRPMGNASITPPPTPESGIQTGPSSGMPFMGGGFMPPGLDRLSQMTGGNTGIAGGLFNRPRLDASTGGYNMPSGNEGGLWNIYNRLSGVGPDFAQAPGRQIFF